MSVITAIPTSPYPERLQMKSLILKVAALTVLAASLSGCVVIVKDDQSKPIHNHETKTTTTKNQA